MRFLAVIVTLLLVSCGKTPSEPIEEHPMVGEVMRLDPPNRLATIKHEAIKDFMAAMTMDYAVRDQADFEKLHVGDKITATVFVQGGEYWAGRFQVQAKQP